MSELAIKNELYWRYSYGKTVNQIADELHISRIWAAHSLATLCRGDVYIEGAHARAKRARKKARFVYISERDRHFDHGV